MTSSSDAGLCGLSFGLLNHIRLQRAAAGGMLLVPRFHRPSLLQPRPLASFNVTVALFLVFSFMYTGATSPGGPRRVSRVGIMTGRT